MKESAQIALSYVKAHAEQLGVDRAELDRQIHVHFPAGAVPKDGPSAGVTMATAIASLVRSEPVAEDVGMTGEITLTGQVLPIGGIREKVLAAQRYGLERIVLPRDNEPDLEELPEEARNELEFILADTIDDVFAVAFSTPGRSRPQATPASERQAAASV
jgi:ATP-dependent Lon protease